MTAPQPPFPATSNQASTHNAIASTPTASVRVIVPQEPPEFGPAAARALLRLLIAVHAKHTGMTNPSGEEP
jgi:hypothetical protein